MTKGREVPMFHKEVDQVAQAAAGKVQFLKTNPAGYFLASMMAGYLSA